MNAPSVQVDESVREGAPPLWVLVLVTVLSGALLSVLAPPLNLHWLHWVAYLPMFWVVREGHGRRNAWLGYLYGIVGVGTIFHWIVDTITLFSNIPFAGALVALLLFSAGFGIPYALLWWAVHPLRRRLGTAWVLALPALQVLIEFASMYLVLFPYNHGVSQYRFPFTWQLASVTGVWGLSFLVFFVNATFAEGIYRMREGRRFPIPVACAGVAALSLTVLFGAWRYRQVEARLQEAPVLRVAQIQTEQSMSHRLSQARQEMLFDWLRETKKIDRGEVDLVVWSEGASPYNVHEGQVKELLAELTREGDFELFLGGGTVYIERDPETGEPEIEAYNSVYLFDDEGEVAGRYDKQVPLPFGEYIPLSGTFPFLRDLIEGPGDFRAGTEPTILEGEYRYAAPICYEAILPSVCRRFPDPDLLINPTNDAWFGDTAAPHQHAMLAAVRSTELGVPMVRSGYTGISFVVEPHGRIHSETPPFERVNRPVEVRMATLPTPYGRWGDWFVVVCAVGLLGGLVATRRRSDGPAGS